MNSVVPMMFLKVALFIMTILFLSVHAVRGQKAPTPCHNLYGEIGFCANYDNPQGCLGGDGYSDTSGNCDPYLV